MYCITLSSQLTMFLQMVSGVQKRLMMHIHVIPLSRRIVPFRQNFLLVGTVLLRRKARKHKGKRLKRAGGNARGKQPFLYVWYGMEWNVV